MKPKPALPCGECRGERMNSNLEAVVKVFMTQNDVVAVVEGGCNVVAAMFEEPQNNYVASEL